MSTSKIEKNTGFTIIFIRHPHWTYSAFTNSKEFFWIFQFLFLVTYCKVPRIPWPPSLFLRCLGNQPNLLASVWLKVLRKRIWRQPKPNNSKVILQYRVRWTNWNGSVAGHLHCVCVCHCKFQSAPNGSNSKRVTQPKTLYYRSKTRIWDRENAKKSNVHLTQWVCSVLLILMLSSTTTTTPTAAL